ncbi:MAG: hypothetical protein AMXMBFR13_26200 [Phycisphaerae bacterium]
MRRPLTQILAVGINGIAHLLKHIQEHIFLEAGQVALARPRVEGNEEAEVDRLQVQTGAISMDRGDHM